MLTPEQTKRRNERRMQMTDSARQIEALETIADHLEEIRGQNVLMSECLKRIASKN
jgi:hypothetical protein